MTSKVHDIASRQNGIEDPGRSRTRTAWNGGLADTELDLPGGLLLAALTSCANSRGHHFTEMAAELGVTYGYIAQLRNGNREVPQISDDFAMACARYLMVPRMTVLMLAGRLTPADVFENEQLMAAEIGRAFAFVCADPKWGPLVTAEMRKTGLDSQFGVVRLYEAATGKKLMPAAVDETTLANEVSKLHAIQDQRKQLVSATSEARKRGPRTPRAVAAAQ